MQNVQDSISIDELKNWDPATIMNNCTIEDVPWRQVSKY